MKVLFLSSWFPNRVSPMNGDFVERHAIAVSLQCKVAVLHVTTDPGNIELFEVHEHLKGNIYEVIIYIRHYGKIVNRLLYFFAYLKGYRLLRRKWGKPDIIHANIINPVAVAAFFLSTMAQVPFVISEHWTGFLSSDHSIKMGRFTRFCVNRAYALIPVTTDLKSALLSLGFNLRYFIVPNVVDTDIFKPEAVHKNSGKKKILHVSSMKEYHKNISGILNVVARLKTKRDDFMITFIGPDTKEQQDLVTSLELSSVVVFEGEKTHEQVALAMQQSDFLVLFSRIENLPCVILEAFSSGLPVISSDVGGIAEWVNQTNGYLVESGNEEELFSAMIRMLDHANEFNSDALHRYAMQNFSMPVIASQFYNIYKEAVHG